MKSERLNDTLYQKCLKKGLRFNHVAEVGVWSPETSNILGFIQDGIRTTLVEPLPDKIESINQYFKNNKNVTLFPFAIYDREGELDLFSKGASTFVGELKSSPALVNDKYIARPEDKVTVQAKLFSSIDDGTIDLLSVDTEGCEWYVLKYMKSRPVVISLETHGKRYINPFINEIGKWMNDNDYVVWYEEKSDTIYVKASAIELTMWEKMKLIF